MVVSEIVRFQTSSVVSLVDGGLRWFLNLSGYRLAGVRLVDGHIRVSSSIEPRIQTSSSIVELGEPDQEVVL